MSTTSAKPPLPLKSKLTLLLFCLHLGFGADCLAASEPTNSRPAELLGPAILAGGQDRYVGPALLSDCGHQLLGSLIGQAVIRSPKPSTVPFALILKSDTPIGTLDAIFIRLDADGARSVKGFSAGARFAIIYASNCFRTMTGYGRLYKVLRHKTDFVVLKVCYTLQSLAKQFQGIEQPS